VNIAVFLSFSCLLVPFFLSFLAGHLGSTVGPFWSSLVLLPKWPISFSEFLFFSLLLARSVRVFDRRSETGSETRSSLSLS
jgi:hypothetical protein